MDKIELNAQETEWADTLGTFEISLSEDYDKRISKLETADLLARSLLSRGVIPEVRFNYFIKPEYNLSNPKKSHEEIFETNGTKGEEILSHPHFLRYLKYFIQGAELPKSLKAELVALKENHSYDDDFAEDASPIIRKHFKSFGSIERTSFAEEVFKLCLDLNLPLAYAKLLRDKVMTWR
jgi:hypothetical protein